MSLIPPGESVLVLCAHPDDEIACAGYLSRLIDDGHPVHYAYFSDCKDSTVALGHDPKALIDECFASCDTLGIARANIQAFDFPTRHFPQYRQEILEVLVRIRKELNPRLVFAASSADIHQDHSTLSVEALRAFKHATVLGYEFPWNVMSSRLDVLVRLEEEHIDRKRRAWACYQTQQSRNYHGPEMIDALARVRGVQANCRFAEAYEALRVVI